ncbi:hypothetical protein [Aquimarina algicola]|uniref:Uncharacterized protein n=1 Tax=Aquimarina algicola TaxID=2589995 RepID=A0A504JB30_9FLAO|nr:hypothetical protein [Aquimarina algicola]TPN85805.1 hypothetical protein FHK87_10980 [Aquimarina algicola]
MNGIDQIVELSKEYLNAHNRMNERFKKWNENKFDVVKSTLNKVREQLINENDFFVNNLYVNSDENKTQVSLRAGQTIVPNSEKFEKGFEINFFQINNGKIYACYYNNSIDKNSISNELFLFDNLEEITEEKVLELVYDGIKKSMKSSFLFNGDK